MKFKNIFCLFLSIVLLTAICSCSSSVNPDTKPEEYKPPEARKVTVTDSDGSEVTTSDNNSKIISLGFQSTSLLIALGAKDLICGVDASSANAGLITKAFPEISNVAVVTDSENKVSAENITAQNPGLVIVTGQFSQYANELREGGLTVAVVKFDSVEQIKASVELIGKLSNTELKATKLSGFYDSALTRLKVMTATENKAKVTLYDEDEVIRELVSNLNCDIVQSAEYVIAKSSDAPAGTIIAPHNNLEN